VSSAREDAERAAALVVKWVQVASNALNNPESMTATERTRHGELAVSAANWLTERAERVAKAEHEAAAKARRDSLAHLPPLERIRRMSEGF